MQDELTSILSYWMQYAVDEEQGGFYGQIDNQNNINKKAAKGAVLNARILWSFSAAYNSTKQKEYLDIADRAFKYTLNHFVDKEYGGIYWSVDYRGQPLDTKKQIYALSFLIYASSEYYKCSYLEAAKQLAIDLYYLIEKYSFDDVKKGYLEAFTKEWEPIADLRLSKKDANEKKTMNTHLHILEAYTNLYRIWPNDNLKQSINLLIKNFTEHIIDMDTWHLCLFFNEGWQPKSNIISYGHDVEAAWLLLEAAELIKDENIIKEIKEIALNIAIATTEGLDKDGGLWYEVEAGHIKKEKHWWPQAEAMIGFFNAYQLTGNHYYLNQSINSWKFTQQFILDKKNGEWFWGINEDYSIMQEEDKAGFWKCPYHNSRACLEIIKRTKLLSI